MTRPVPRRVRRTVFGRDPAAYDRARLGYPPRVYEILRERCGLRPGARVFEIGPGTGQATRELLRRGAGPLTVIEADPRLARYLVRTLPPGPAGWTVLARPFESVSLPPEAFDLGVAASSFHWLPRRTALRRVARALRPGGWWASWTNLHGDPYRASAFHRALQPLYRARSDGRRAAPPSRTAAARDRAAWLADLRASGRFERIRREDVRWTVRLPTERAVALWATFSDVLTLRAAERRRFLEGLRQVVDERFGGVAPIPMLTPIYTARRR